MSSDSILSLRRKEARKIQDDLLIPYAGGTPCKALPQIVTKSDTLVTGALTAQASLNVTIKDTTRRTRPIGSDVGEFELFKFTLASPIKQVYRTVRTLSQTIVPGCTNLYTNKTSLSHFGVVTGSGAIFSKVNLDALRLASLSELEGVMLANVTRMLARTVPSNRRLTLFRSIAELKDLPRSLLSLRGSLVDFSQSLSQLPKGIVGFIYSVASSKHIPQEYLSYWFGWRQLYNDLIGMLVKPAEISKEVNYLLNRRGKPTTFRSLSNIPGVVTTTPSWTYDSANTLNGLAEVIDETTTRHARKHELRLVINATFDFPHIGIPALKERLFKEKLGVSPSATDFYNLVPWSWLLDWFTGLGNYIDLIDTINRADDLYNWGFLTGVTHGRVETLRRSHTDSTDRYAPPVGSALLQTITKSFVHTSFLDYHTQIRKDIVNAYDVKSTLDPSTLSAYQASIIGAILLAWRR
jgi:hypothetical protein